MRNYNISFKTRSCWVVVLHFSAAVFKFVEPPENDEKPENQKSKVKFKIMSLKVKGQMEYVPEMVSMLPVLVDRIFI